MLAAPAHLSPAAREVFDRLATQVAGSRSALPLQLLVDLLTQYSEAHAMRELATRQLAAAGSLLAASPNGVTYPSPQLKIVEQAERCMDRCFRRLGFGGKAEPAPFALDLDND